MILTPYSEHVCSLLPETYAASDENVLRKVIIESWQVNSSMDQIQVLPVQ